MGDEQIRSGTIASFDDRWYHAMFDASTVPMALADEQGLLTAANAAYCAMVGRPWPQIAGRSSREFTHPDDIDHHHAMESMMADADRRGEPLRVEKRYVQPDGTVRWGWVSASSVAGPDGRVWTMAVVHDTTDRRTAEQNLLAAASTDPLTGLLNRRGWEDWSSSLDEMVDRADPLSFAVIDLDRFKAFNDTHGHFTGDRLLVEFSRAAVATVRAPGVVARWGGEEFAIALPHTDADRTADVLRRLAAVVPEGQTFCAGHTTLRADESTAECFQRADALMYEAKRAGPGRVVGG
ncbi:sensor domain-containing diguanylate cyclase [Williamsia sp. SKLECPSW1]